MEVKIIQGLRVSLFQFIKVSKEKPSSIQWFSVPSDIISTASLESFIVNEFARQMATLKLSNAVRAKVFRSTLEITAAELDCREAKDAYWVTSVEVIFNGKIGS